MGHFGSAFVLAWMSGIALGIALAGNTGSLLILFGGLHLLAAAYWQFHLGRKLFPKG